MAISYFTFKEIIMTKLFKKTHPATLGTLIVVGVIVTLILVFFFI